MELPEITKVEKIDLKNGDYLAVFVKGNVPMAIIEDMKRRIEIDFLPTIVKVQIFNADLVEIKSFRVEQ